jgi:hypothetical protein
MALNIECFNAECRYAVCHFSECRDAEWSTCTIMVGPCFTSKIYKADMSVSDKRISLLQSRCLLGRKFYNIGPWFFPGFNFVSRVWASSIKLFTAAITNRV